MIGDHYPLFEDEKDFIREPAPKEPKIQTINDPIWTKNKARLIDRYLYFFVLVAKHGTYIDAFAAPQYPSREDAWAAKLVLESEPYRLRNFYLFDNSARGARRLEQLRDSFPSVLRDKDGRRVRRSVEVAKGDSNILVPQLLRSGELKRDATFCLLDQRTFECQWSMVEQLASYKATDDLKMELFYFFADGWLPRALAAQKRAGVIERWWGRSDWERLRKTSVNDIRVEFENRLRSGFGYKSVKSWPIFDSAAGNRKMYHMIHATDHPEAPRLMSRAYRRATQRREKPEQFLLSYAKGDDDEENVG